MKVLVAIAIALMGLTGCSPDDDASTLKPGTCIGKEIRDNGDRVPDLTAIVPCSEPHVYEINGFVDLPAAALTGSTDEEKLANRADLAAPTTPKNPTPQRVAFDRFLGPACLKVMQERSGLDAITVAGKSALEAQVNAVVRTMNLDWRSLSSEKDWLQGKRQAVCSSRFTENSGDQINGPTKPAASRDGKPVVPALLTSRFPADWRICDTPDEKDVFVPGKCSDQHFAELAFSFNAKAVFGTRFVEGFDPATASDAEYAKLDEACSGALEHYLAPGWDTDLLKGRGDTGTAGWGTTGAEFYPVLCRVVPKDSQRFDLPGGSLVDATGKGIELVEIG